MEKLVEGTTKFDETMGKFIAEQYRGTNGEEMQKFRKDGVDQLSKLIKFYSMTLRSVNQTFMEMVREDREIAKKLFMGIDDYGVLIPENERLTEEEFQYVQLDKIKTPNEIEAEKRAAAEELKGEINKQGGEKVM